jgi:hypothetical protein
MRFDSPQCQALRGHQAVLRNPAPPRHVERTQQRAVWPWNGSGDAGEGLELAPPRTPGTPIERAARPPGDAWSSIGARDARDVQATHISNLVEISGVRVITSLALSCASNMPGRGREVQAEWPRTLDADRASFKALL